MKTRKFLTICLCLSIPFFLKAQLSLDWAFQVGSTSSDFIGAVNKAENGNLISFTEYTDTTDLDPGIGQDIVVPVRGSLLALSTFLPSGEYVHSALFDAGFESGGSFLELKDEKLKLLIYFSDSLVYRFQNQSNTISTGSGKHACFVTLGTDGQILDTYTFPAPHSFYFSKLFTLPDGSIIVGGGFSDTFSIDPDNSLLSIISNGGDDGLLARLDADYNVQWMHAYGSSGDDYIEDLDLNNNNIYFTLTHEETLMVPTTNGPITFPSNGEDNNVFGYASLNGTIQSAYAFGGDLGDQIRGITADNEGNIYLNGYFEGTVNFQKPSLLPVVYMADNESDGFVSKYAADGSLIWARIFTDTYYGGVYTLSLQRGNELYLSGAFTEKADLDPGPDSIIANSNSRGDVYVAKLTTDGSLVWVYSFPGNDYEGIRTVLTGAGDKLYVHGYFYGDLDCDPTENQTLLDSYGGTDFFMMAFSEEGLINNSNQIQNLSALIYPNPATDGIQVNCEGSIDTATVFAMDGRLQVVPVSIDQDHCTINLKGLTAGIYFVRIQSGNQFSVSKIIKQ